MSEPCSKCLLPVATHADYQREHPSECDVQAGTGESCWCGSLCWESADSCAGDRGAALNAAALRVARWIRDHHGCPHDTNGDGDCGQVGCPLCGRGAFRALDVQPPTPANRTPEAGPE